MDFALWETTMNCEPCEPCEVLPPLDLCVRGILEAFDHHASKDEDRLTLSKKELRGMLKEEIGPMMEGAENPSRLADLFDMMDQDGDKKVDFPEFMTALGVVTCIIHNRLYEIPIMCQPPQLPGSCGPIGEPIVCDRRKP